MKKIFFTLIFALIANTSFSQTLSKKIECKNDSSGAPTCLDAFILDDVTLALMASEKNDEASAQFNDILSFDRLNVKSERGFAETRKMHLIMSMDVFGAMKKRDELLTKRRLDVVNHLSDKKSFILPVSQLARTTVNEIVPGKSETRVLSFKAALDADRISIGKTESNICSKKMKSDGFNCIRIKNMSEALPQNLPDNLSKNYFSDLPLARFSGLRAYKQTMRPLNKTQLVLENDQKLMFGLQIETTGKVKQQGANTVIDAVAKKAIIYGPRGAIVGHDLASE